LRRNYLDLPGGAEHGPAHRAVRTRIGSLSRDYALDDKSVFALSFVVSTVVQSDR
jgi:hypothetical protein